MPGHCAVLPLLGPQKESLFASHLPEFSCGYLLCYFQGLLLHVARRGREKQLFAISSRPEVAPDPFPSV